MEEMIFNLADTHLFFNDLEVRAHKVECPCKVSVEVEICYSVILLFLHFKLNQIWLLVKPVELISFLLYFRPRTVIKFISRMLLQMITD